MNWEKFWFIAALLSLVIWAILIIGVFYDFSQDMGLHYDRSNSFSERNNIN